MCDSYDGGKPNEKLLSWIINKITKTKVYLELDANYFDENFIFTYEFVRSNLYLTHLALKNITIEDENSLNIVKLLTSIASY